MSAGSLFLFISFVLAASFICMTFSRLSQTMAHAPHLKAAAAILPSLCILLVDLSIRQAFSLLFSAFFSLFVFLFYFVHLRFISYASLVNL